MHFIFFNETKLCSLDHSVSPFVFTFPHPQGSFFIQLLLLLYTHFPLGFAPFNKLLLCMNYMPDTRLGTRIQRWIRQSHHLCEKNIVKRIKCKIDECQGRQQKASPFPQAREKISETHRSLRIDSVWLLFLWQWGLFISPVFTVPPARARPRAVRGCYFSLIFLRVWAIYILVCMGVTILNFVIHEQLKRPSGTHRQDWQQAALLNVTIVTALFELHFFFFHSCYCFSRGSCWHIFSLRFSLLPIIHHYKERP